MSDDCTVSPLTHDKLELRRVDLTDGEAAQLRRRYPTEHDINAAQCNNIYGGHKCTQDAGHGGPHTCGDVPVPCSGQWSDDQGHYPIG